MTGTDVELGKPQGSDERHGKVTYVSLYGLDEARELAARSHNQAIEALGRVNGENGDLLGIADYIYRREQ